jgi:hypothetical protein
MPSNYTVVDYYDLRPLDWVSGKRMPLEPGESHVCDRCGAEHAVVYVVEDLTTHKTYAVGSGCAKASFGFDPASDKQATRIVASKKQEAAALVNDRRLKEVENLTRDISSQVRSLPRPPVVHAGDAVSKYAHYAGQLVRKFKMGDVEAEEWQQSSGWNDRTVRPQVARARSRASDPCRAEERRRRHEPQPSPYHHNNVRCLSVGHTSTPVNCTRPKK